MGFQEIHDFAREKILSTIRHRYTHREFSRSLWKEMAGIGLFGFLVPEEYGGTGWRHEAFIDAIEAFVRGGHDLGLCLSWLDHLIIHSQVIARFGTKEQRERYLPNMARGEWIGALAASEPGTGANPAKMCTRAEKVDGFYRLKGHKIFITNGPVADCIIVLARTGPLPGKEGISALILDVPTPGFHVNGDMDLGFLYTSPHGELVFQDCDVPQGNVLGAIGQGHTGISKAVFAWERFIVMIALIAHFRLILDEVVRRISGAVCPPMSEVRRELALLHCHLEGYRALARMCTLEVLPSSGLTLRQIKQLIFLGVSLAHWLDQVQGIMKSHSVPIEFPLDILLQDARLMHVARRIHETQVQRIAEQIFEKTSAEDSSR